MQATTEARKTIDRWTLLTCLGVGAFMLWAAGRYTVFDDEALSCRLYALPMGEMLRELWRGADPDPPLYYIFQNVWVHVFGVGPWGLRSLSIIFFVISLPVIRAAGAAWFDHRTGLATMAICGLHPAHLFFGFAGRWYGLMFLLVAALLWATAKLADDARSRPGPIIVWAVIAAAVCYTNYFGPVVIGLLWWAGVWRSLEQRRAWRPWLTAAVCAAVLYAPWAKPLLEQVRSFVQPPGGGAAYVATAARTVMALTAGNLATVRAWWVWAPMAVFSVALIVLVARRWQTVRSIAVVVLGCFALGVASRTMIDKYVMTFTGPACLLAAAAVIGGGRSPRRRAEALLARVTATTLAIGWLGCGVNLVRKSDWSSLRWLDPFEQVLTELMNADAAPPPGAWVLTHPSARYYHACLVARRGDAAAKPSGFISADTWRRRAAAPGLGEAGGGPMLAHTAKSALAWIERGRLDRLLTLETAGFVKQPDRAALHEALARSFVLTDERQYLADPDAAWKDRLDPSVRHPAHRITVRMWTRRE